MVAFYFYYILINEIRALMPSGWNAGWHCGVRASGSKLLAFIAAIPALIRIYDKTIQMVEINFLCVHKKLRSKRLAPVLIRGMYILKINTNRIKF
jgi:hypothetical protein